MGIFQKIGSELEEEALRKLAQGQGNVEEPGSAAHADFQRLLGQAGPSLLKDVFGRVAGGLDSTQYAQHMTPVNAGGNPLAQLGSGPLGAVASTLLGHLIGGGFDPEELLHDGSGVASIDPRQMNADEVAALARYAQQNHSELFGKAIADLAQKNPSIIGALLGKAGLSTAASQLASHFLGKSAGN